MATEYKLSYTASEIDAKLGKIDSLADAHADIRTALNNKLSSSELQAAINTSLAQAKASGEFDGADGKTPVKGTDYWTAADKSAMVSDVLAALPTWNGGSY